MGKRLVTPLNQLQSLRSVPWLRDLFPDMLWLCFHLAADDTGGMGLVARVLDVIDEAIAQVDLGPEYINDGRLTNFERIPENVRPRVLASLHSRGVYGDGFPEDWAAAYCAYPDAPGLWLIQPRLDRLRLDPDVSQRALSPVALVCWHGQDLVPTRAKAMVFRGRLKAGKVAFPPEMAAQLEPLTRYPANITEEERRSLEPFIRATFLAFVRAGDGGAAVDWAKRFWRQNWVLYRCQTRDASRPVPDVEPLRQSQRELGQRAKELGDHFKELAKMSDPDLFAPDRHEVLTGIVARAMQLAFAVSRAPSLWSTAVGMPSVRSLVESLIVVRWMLATEAADPTVYAQFKEYGRGQLKLFKLHMEEFAATLSDVPNDLAAYLDSLQADVDEDVMEWAQDIPLTGTFAKVDLRKMSVAVGLEDRYRLVFQPASSVTHGEWPVLDRSVLQRCINPLHGGHRIPRENLEQTTGGPQIAVLALEIAEEVLNAYAEGIGDGKLDPPVAVTDTTP